MQRLQMKKVLLAGGVALALLVLGCTSPESSRSRGGGPGADTGNRGAVVEMHEGSWIFHRTPPRVTVQARHCRRCT